MNQRLRPSQRIRKRQAFDVFFKKGKLARGTFFNLWVCRHSEIPSEGPGPKLGMIVSRKTSPKATERNLWKRRIREVFRHTQHSLDANLSILIQAKKQASVPSAQAIEQEMKNLLKKTGGLK